MKSPIKWVGGKSKSVKTIIPMIPEHLCYVEPFFGGGWVYFSKDKSAVEVINDVNGELINFFEVLRNDCNGFIKNFDFCLKSRELYLEFRKNQNLETLTKEEKAFRFYYIVMNAFGGMYRMNKRGECNAAFASSPEKKAQSTFWDLEKIKMAHERLKETIIENRDYRKIIELYDSKDTFFFFDPPYDSDLKYNGESESFNYIELLSILRSLKGKFILTLNSELKVLFKEFIIVENMVYYGISSKKIISNPRKEVIIKNYV